MSFLDTFSAALPHGIGLEDLKILVPSQWWQDKPEQAAVSALCRCGKFDTQDYLKRYPDVAQKGLDPVLHFVQHGIAEKRHFKCLPDTNWGQSKVRLAYEYFQKGEHEKALQVYEELSEQMGEKNFVANIAICKKKLGSKNSLKSLAKEISQPKPKVSVLIPVYNNAQYLHECIDSVINQTLKEIEIIIINDGSTDPEAVRILNDYAAKDNRIKLIHKKNTGYGHSMNVGLDNATGEYIGIVESDDYINHNMYLELYSKAKTYSIDVIKSNISTFFGKKENRKFINYKLAHEHNYNKVIYPKENIKVFDYNGFLAICSGLYSFEFIKKKKLRFTESPGASFQDIAFWFKSICLSEKYYFSSHNFYYLRRDNEISSVNDSKKLYPVCYEYMQIKNFLHINSNDYNMLINFYVKRMFLSYKWCLERAHIDMKKEFFQRVISDFLELKYVNKLKTDLFSIEEKKYLDNILKQCDKNKIACIYTAHLSNGGLERTACDLSFILKELGYSVFFILIYPEKISYDYYGEIILKDLKNPVLKKILQDATIIFDYKFKDKLKDDDLIKYCIDNFASKYISTIHSEGERCEYYFNITYRYLNKNLSKIKKIICVSERVKNSFIERYGNNENVIVVHNMVDINEYQRIINLENHRKKFDYILFAGRLDATHVKGIDILIPAFLNSSTSNNTKLVIAGSGELDDNIQKMIETHTKGDSIISIGFVNLIREGWLKNCNFIVAPSRYEGFSMILLEALACEIPVLTSNAGVSPELIKPGKNGYTIKNHDISELSRAIDYMSNNYKSMKKNCINSLSICDKNQYKKKIFEVLKDVETPRLSVIIPIYNAEKYILECISSVLCQSIENVEIICIDDGSTDNSAQIIKSIRDSRIKYVYQENSGSGHARNKGIDIASGEFIAFLDADDKIPHPDSYKLLYENAKKHALPISGGNLYYLIPEGKMVENKNKEMIFSQNCVIDYGDWQYDFCYQNFIYNRFFLNDNKLRFPQYKRYQDPVFFVRTMHKSQKFCVIPEFVYCYRVREDKKKWKWTEEMSNDLLLAIIDNLNFARKNNLSTLFQNTKNHFKLFESYINNSIDNEITNTLMKELYAIAGLKAGELNE